MIQRSGLPDRQVLREKRALQIILPIALLGSVLSGYLSYLEFFEGMPPQACPPLGEPGTVLGYPICVYGLFLYVAIAIVAAGGLRETNGTSGAPGEEEPRGERGA